MGCILQIGFCPWLFFIYLKQTNTSASSYCFLLQVINFLLSIFCIRAPPARDSRPPGVPIAANLNAETLAPKSLVLEAPVLRLLALMPPQALPPEAMLPGTTLPGILLSKTPKPTPPAPETS